MSQLPVRRAQFKLPAFAAWLASNGAEVGVPTNPYEVIRYRAYHGGSPKALTHIVYAKESGLLTFTGAAREHYLAFASGEEMAPVAGGNPPAGWVRADGGPFRKDAQPRADAQSKRRQKLLERDGDECWFCGDPLGDDMTFEHLVPKSHGGRNALANYALAHATCNHKAGDLPLIQKIELRAAMRAEKAGRKATSEQPA